MPRTNIKEERGFTLIELLLVIAIILILGAILLFAINPAEQLKKSRDSQRISDLNTLATAINLYLSDEASPEIGADTTTYFSYISASATCSTHTFVDLYYTATETTKACEATEAAATLTDGTGWVPVNLNNIDGGSPISALPLDPIGVTCAADATTAGSCDTYYYRYTSNGDTKYVMDAVFESTSNAEKCQNDGGGMATSFEIGNNLNPDSLTRQARDNDGGC